MRKVSFKSYCLLALLFGVLVGSSSLSAQITESFEVPVNTTNEDKNNAFSFGYFNDWIAVTGTPNTQDLEPAIEEGAQTFFAFDGSYYARAFSGVINCSGGGKAIGESIAYTFPFKECTDYDLSFQLAKKTFDPFENFVGEHPVRVIVALANNLSNIPPPSGNCFYEQLYLDGSMQHLATYNYSASNSDQQPVWSFRSIPFTPDENYSHLVFFPEYRGTGNGGVDVFFDDFELNEGEVPQFPDFYAATEDDLTPQTEICYGEDVWVCLGDANFNWINTQFTIYKEPAGSFYTKTGTVYGVDKNGCYNLSEMIRRRGNVGFIPDQSYNIKMSIQHPECGWVDRYYPIRIVCCEDELDASFEYETTGGQTSLGVSAEANTDYTNIGGVHEFCLFVDLDGDGQSDQMVDCSSTPDFEALNLDPNLVYYLQHCVETLCGFECKIVEIKNCFVHPCKEECKVADLRCLQNDQRTYLAWAGTEGAVSYEVEVLVNDPACGCSGQSRTISFNTDGTFIRLEESPDCFSFRVKTTCEIELPNGQTFTIERWSDSICPSCNDLDFLTDGDGSNPRSATPNNLATNQIAIYPNPFKSELNLQLGKVAPGGAKVEIYTTTGQLVYRHLHYQSELIDLGNLTYSGLLWIKVSNGEETYLQNVLKQ